MLEEKSLSIENHTPTPSHNQISLSLSLIHTELLHKLSHSAAFNSVSAITLRERIGKFFYFSPSKPYRQQIINYELNISWSRVLNVLKYQFQRAKISCKIYSSCRQVCASVHWVQTARLPRVPAVPLGW